MFVDFLGCERPEKVIKEVTDPCEENYRTELNFRI